MASARLPTPPTAASIRRFDIFFPLLYASIYMCIAAGIHLALFPIGDTGVESDFYSELAPAAQNLARGEFSVEYFPYKGPVYPLVLAGLHAIVRVLGADWYRTGVLLNVLLAGLSLGILYRLVQGLYGRATAVAVMIATSLLYEFFLHAHKASSDLLFFFLAYLAIHLVVSGSFSASRLFLAGCVSGLAFLTRYIGAFLPVTTLLAFWVVNPRSWYMRLKATRSAAFLLGFLVICVPWFLANLAETGRLLNTLNLQNVVQEYYSGAKADEIPAAGFTSLTELIRYDPLHFWGHFLSNIPRRFLLDAEHLVWWAAGLFALIGLLRFFWQAPNRAQTSFLVYPLGYFLALCLVFYLPRFSLPTAPAYFAVAFSLLLVPVRQEARDPFSRLRRWLGSTPGKIVAFTAIAVMIAIQVPAIIAGVKYYHYKRPLYILPAAEFLADQARASNYQVVMARKAHLAHYAGLRYQPYPASINKLQDFFAFGWEHLVDVVAYSAIEREHYPHTEFLPRLDDCNGAQKIYDEEDIALFQCDRSLPPRVAANSATLGRMTAALERAEATGDVQHTFMICRALGAELKGKQEWEQASYYFQRALDLTPELPRPLSSAELDVLRLNLSLAHLRAGNHAAGLAVLGENLDNLSRAGDPEHVAMAHSLLAKHLNELGRRDEAYRHLVIARDMYHQLGRQDQVAVLEKALEDLRRRR